MDVLPSSTTTAATAPLQGTNATDFCTDDCFLLRLLNDRPNKLPSVFILLLSLLLFVLSNLTIVVTRRSTRLKQQPAATFVINLAVTGRLMSILLSVFSVAHLSLNLSLRTKVVLGVLLPRFLHIVTALALACLTVDRYLALCWPLRYHSLLTDSRCLLLVFASWCLPALVLGLAWFFASVLTPCPDIRPWLLIYLVLFTFAIGAVIVMYFLIAREFRRPIEGAVGGDELEEARRRTAKELMVVVLVNLLLATPDMGMKLYLLNCPKTVPILYYLALQLLLVHLICFYPLYAWKNRDFRRAMIETCAAFRTFVAKVLGRLSSRMAFVRASLTRVSFSRMYNSRVSSNSSAVSSSGVSSSHPTASSSA